MTDCGLVEQWEAAYRAAGVEPSEKLLEALASVVTADREEQ
ncbi:hypothetical protein [Corynebacterium poyangense]|nr:hypothetical protein [Corynebacterium poyangense]